MSDLHLEHDSDFTLQAHAPYLALCGDIGTPGTNVSSFYWMLEVR
jgi:hypothetical protein